MILHGLPLIRPFKANVRRQKKRAYGELSAEYSGITEEDRAFLTLCQTSDEKHAHLVGKKRKEASQQEQRELSETVS